MKPDSTPVLLVTGGARRVGAEIARQLHARGARIVVHYRHSSDEAESLAMALNTQRPDSARCVAGDLALADVPERVCAMALACWGRLDGVVNNASSFYPTAVGEIDAQAWDELIGSNLRGPLFLSQAAAPHLRATGGGIVNIVDIHAERPLKGYALYCAAKAGLLGLTRALATELAPEVRVNGVSPGPILWPEDGQFPGEERQHIIADTLLGREGSPADIARTVSFLMFDAPYITGQVIAVDGGRSAHLG